MIKPYYKTELGVLYHGDCREILLELKHDQVDAVITDPIWPNASVQLIGAEDPYGLFLSAVNLLPSTTKRLAVHLGCDSDPRFLSAVPEALPFFRVCWLRYVMPHYKGRLMYGSDVAYFFGSPPKSIPGRHVISGEFTDTSSDGKQSDHPCPRKLGHINWIIGRWTDEGETILDPFLGSGTTAIICERLDRRWIGIEISKEYCDIAVKRIEAERAQLKLDL